jgi:hypothetical protein
MAKQTKTRSELAALVMAEIRRAPECADVQMVTIIRPPGLSWEVATVRHGGSISPESLEGVDYIVTNLRARFDLGTGQGRALDSRKTGPKPKRKEAILKFIKSMRRKRFRG